MTRRFLAIGLGLAFASAGCPTVPQIDAAPYDVVIDNAHPDRTGGDSAMDGGDAGDDIAPNPDAPDAVPPADGATDAALDAPSDATTPDAAEDVSGLSDIYGYDIYVYDVPGVFDGGSLDDASIPHSCDSDASSVPASCTTNADCLRAEVCIPSGCGSTLRCQPAGRPCITDGDCLAAVQSCFHGVCAPTGTECGDSRACPLGFTCEGAPGSTRCVNRRHRCEGGTLLCPYNSICYEVPGIAPFCLALGTPCSNDGACILSTCSDLNGDAKNECAIVGPCTGATICPSTAEGNTCEMPPSGSLTICGAHGFCSAARPCPSGYDCVDVWGNGVRECRPTADTCHTHADCAAGQLCYTRITESTDPSPTGCM